LGFNEKSRGWVALGFLRTVQRYTTKCLPGSGGVVRLGENQQLPQYITKGIAIAYDIAMSIPEIIQGVA
jgi:hypothetical protein